MSFLNPHILLKTSLASLIVYEEDPKKMLEETDWLKSVDHKIDDICFSRQHSNELKYFKQLNEIKYLLIDDKSNKNLYISFRGTHNIEDILADVQIYPFMNEVSGRFHSGFYKRAEHVPINYFLEKLVKDEYDLVLTGHSLGAAVAAMITIKLLYLLDMTEKYAKKIKFIGYGCPSIADIYFKNDVDVRYKENFIFIKNESDIVVEIINYVSYLVYKRQENDDYFVKLCNFINGVLQNLTNLEIINSLCQQMKLIIGTLSKLIIPEYSQFGTLYELTKTNGLIQKEIFDFNEQDFREMFNDPGLLIKKIQNHYIKNYYLNLKKKYFEQFIDMINRNRPICLNINQDLSIRINNCQDYKPIKIIKGDYNSDIILTLNETPKNVEYLVAIKLILENKAEKVVIFYKGDLNLPCDDGSSYYRFNLANDKIFDSENNLIKQSFTFQFYSHFDQHPIEMTLRKVEVENGMKQKQREVENLPFDLLYLHAAFYFHSLNRMNEQISNENFLDIKNQLFDIFTQLDDQILKEIWQEKCKGYSYNENDINEMKSLAKSYFDYIQFKDQEKISQFITHIESVKFENSFVGFKNHISNSIIYGSETLLRSLIPYLYEIKKRTCDISMLSDELKNTIFQLSFIQKCQRIGEMGVIRLLQVVSGTAVKTTSAVVTGIVAGAAGVVAGAVVAGPAGAGVVLGNLAATGAATGVGVGAATVGIGEKLAKEVSDNIGDKMRYVFTDSRYIPSWDQDKVYKNIIKQCKSDDQIFSNEINMTLAEYEKFYDQRFIDKWTNKKDHIIFKLIIINSKLRGILLKHHLIGVIGTKKAGKSTFVELVTNQTANSSISIGTSFATAYLILDDYKELKYNNVAILDYPHSNSHLLEQKLEFIFTRLLLDHIYLIFEIKDKGETDQEKNLYKLVTSNNFFGISFVYNKSDVLFDSDDNISQTFHDFKSDLYKNLKVYSDEKVIFSCMKKKGISEITEELKQNQVLLRNDLREHVFLTIGSLL